MLKLYTLEANCISVSRQSDPSSVPSSVRPFVVVLCLSVRPVVRLVVVFPCAEIMALLAAQLAPPPYARTGDGEIFVRVAIVCGRQLWTKTYGDVLNYKPICTFEVVWPSVVAFGVGPNRLSNIRMRLAACTPLPPDYEVRPSLRLLLCRRMQYAVCDVEV